MIARQRRRMRERVGALMTIDTRQTRLAGARSTLATWAALLLATLGVLVGTVTSTAAQSLTRGPVLVETHHTDLAGNIRLSTNEAGDVTQRLDYAPFGEVDNRPCGPTNDPTPAPQFQGKLRDPKTCLDDFGARDYYMVTGRFQSVDPVLPVETALRDPQQWNRYAYARNNPLIYTDPDGRLPLPLMLAAVASVTYQLVFNHEAVLNAPAPGDETVASPREEAIAVDAARMAVSRLSGGLSGAIATAMAGRGQVTTPSRRETGSYTNTHASGRTYDGKGSRQRSQESGRRLERKTGDAHVATEWKPAGTDRDGYKNESRSLDAHGGPKSQGNYNRIDSPGKKYRQKDREP
jgi:RHS repeat-associated protein